MKRFAVIVEESAQIEAFRRDFLSITVITSWPYEVVRHFETLIRRRRSLISAQGWSDSDNLGFKNKEEVLP
jgi:hypothetical protein